MNKFLPFISFLTLAIFLLSNNAQAQNCPTLNGFLVNSCADPIPAGNLEGMNEMVVFHTGSYEYDLNNLTIEWSNGAFAPTSGFCLSGCSVPSTDINASPAGNTGFTVNPSRVAELNTIAFCPEGDLLVSPTSNIIPADATVVVFAGGSCWPEPVAGAYFPYDFSAFCGQGPIYVIFKNDCAGNGKFGDNASGGQVVGVTFGSASDGCNSNSACSSYTVTYIGGNYNSPANNGAGTLVSGSGVTTGTYVNSNCNPPGFIPPTGAVCDQTPPDVAPIALCGTPSAANPITQTIDVTYVANGANLEWYNAQVGGTLLGTTTTASPDFTYTFTNSNSIWVLSDDADCVNPSCRVEVPVTVFPIPTVSFSPTSACANTQVSLLGSSNEAGATFSWYIESPTGVDITGALNITDNPIVFTPTETGDYLVSLQVFGVNCSNTFDGSFTVNPSPTVNITGGGALCSGANLNLGTSVTPVGASTYAWSATNGGTISGATGGATITATSAGTYNVTVTQNGCSATDSQPVGASPSPTASISGPSTVCPSSSIVLNASGAGAGGSYLWSAGAGGTITSVNNIAAVTVTGAATYTVTVSNSAGCTHTAQQDVSAASAPTANISGPTTICSSGGSNVTLSASGGGAGGQYAWTTTNGAIAGATNTANISASTAGTYVVMVTNTAGCTATNQYVVTAVAPPNANISAAPSTTICPGGSITLTASGGGTYQWIQNGTPIVGETNATLLATAAGSYSVIITVGACTATAVQNISMAASNPVASITGGSSLCAETTLGLTALGAGAGGTYAWSASGGGVISTPLNVANVTITSAGTYTVTVTNSSGCTDEAVQNISAGTNPNAQISGLTSLCVGATITLTASGGSSYQWQLNGADIAGETGTTLSVNATGSYTVIATNAQGCSATSPAHIVTQSAALNPAISGITTICSGGNSVTLTASGGIGYQWQLNGTDINGANGTTYTANTAGTYAVVVSGVGGCTASTSHVISNTNATVPTISGNNTFCTGGNSLTLTSSAASSYQWQASGNDIPTATSNTYTVTAPGTYTVVTTDALGCAATSLPFAVTAVSPPDATTIPPTSSLCNNNLPGNTLSLDLDDLVSGQAGGTWATNAPASAILAGNVFNADGLTAGSYSVTYTLNATPPCTAQSTTQNITVVFCPANCTDDAEFNSPADICGNSGSTLNLNSLFTATTTTGGTWTSNAPAGTITGSNTFNAAGLSGVYNITYTVTAAAGCPNESFTAQINVVAPPDATTIAPTAILCSAVANNTIDLAPLVTGDTNGVWTCPQSPSAIVGNTFDATGLTAGNYTLIYTVTATTPCVGSNQTQQSISVVSPQNTDLTQSTCTNTYILNAGVAGSGVWAVTGALAATLADATSPTTNVTLNGGEGNYTFVWTPTSGSPCINTVTVSLTFATTGAFAGNDETVCGAVYDFGASGGTGTWTYTGPGTAVFSDNTSPTANVTVSDYGSYTFIWTVTSGACSGSDEVTIFFFPEPTADPTPATINEEVCGFTYNLNPAVVNPATGNAILGDWTDITGAGGIPIPAGIACEWQYTGPAGANVSFFPNATTPEATVTVDIAGTYTFAWVCDGNGIADCGLSNIITIQFIAPLNFEIDVNCLGTTQYTVDVVITGGLTPYTINGTTIGGNSYSETFADGVNYSITIDDNSPCAAQSQGGLNPSCGCPPVPSPVLSGNSTYCQNEPIPTFTVTPFAPNYQYDWYLTGNNTPILSNSLTFVPPADGDYYVVAVVQDGCTSLPTNFSVYQTPNPPLPNLLPNYTYCQNETAGVLATAQTVGGTIYWIDSNGNSGSGASFTPATNTIGSVTYDVFEETLGFCLGATATTTITVNNCACPELASISGATNACSGGDITLTANLNDPAGNLDHIEWHDENGNLVSGNTITRTISGCSPQTFNYTLEIYCNNNPAVPFQIETVPVTFYPIPTANVTLSNNGCTLTATPTCPDFGIVGSNVANSSTNGDNSIITFNVINNAAAAVGLNCINTASNAFDCTIVVDCPVIDVITPNARACSGEAVALSATIDDPTNQMHHVEWVNDLGIVVATSNSTNTLNVSVSNSADNGCNPEVFNYTFNVYCNTDSTVISSSQEVPVTFYPIPTADISLTADGCTVIATPDCPNFGIQGSPIQMGIGTDPYSFTVRSNDAFSVGIVSACAVTFTGNFNCDNVLPCPSIGPLGNLTVCSGQSFDVIPPIINSNQMSSANWTDELGNVVSNTSNLNDLVLINNTCDIVTRTFTCSVYCVSDPTVPSFQADVTVAVQPAFNAALLAFDEDPNCINPPTVSATTCLNYIVTPINVPAPQAGDNTSTWDISYNGGIGCIDETYTYDYTCSGCFTVTNPADATASICDGDTPNWAAITSNITIDNPATFGAWQWYTDAAMTNIAQPSDWQYQGNSCDPYSITFYIGGNCTLATATDLIAGGQVVVTIYPNFDATLLQSTSGDCNNLPTLTSTCPNYILTLDAATMPTLPISTSGVTEWNISINGSSCFNQTYQVPYTCGGCPVAVIDTPAPANACGNDPMSISLSVTPNTAVLGTDYTIQWQANGVDIAGETGITLNQNASSNNCNISNTQYTALFTCLLPVPQPAQAIDAGTVTVHPLYDPDNINIVNIDCIAPTVSTLCDYTISAPVPVPVAGQSGTSVWTISSSNACFANTTVSVDYNCPQCPTITAVANGSRNICNGTVLSNADLDAIEATVVYTDNSNMANGFAWFADASLTTPLSPADYTTANNCEPETITIYLALLCTDGTQTAAGTYTLTVYPTPTTAAAAGGCSLAVIPNCVGNITIEYLVGGTWQATPPTNNPTDGQTVDWRAYISGAPDTNADGNPDCVQSGTATAQSCNCTAPATPPLSITTDIAICEGATNTEAFEVSIEAGAFIVWSNAAGDSLASGNTYLTTIPGTYTAQAFSIADTCAGQQITATLSEIIGETVSINYTDTLCIGDAAVMPIVTGVAGGTYSVSGGANINTNTGEFTPDLLGTFTITFTPTDNCDTGDNTPITVESCAIICTAPPAPIALVDTLSVCAGETNTTAFEVQAVAPDMVITWYNAANEQVATGTTFVTNTIGTYMVQVEMLNDTCKSTPISVVLSETTPQTLTVNAGVDISICEGEAISLQGNLNGIGTTIWTSANGTFGNAANLNTSYNTATIGTDTLLLTATGAGSCVIGDQDTLIVTIQPSVIILVSGDNAIFAGESTELTAVGASNYTWTPTQSLSCTDCATPTANPITTTTYLINTTDDCAEPAQYTVTVTAVSKPEVQTIVMPTAFSPNGDGKNDLLKPDYSGVITNYYFAIYSRWGQKLFETTDLNTGWDGKLEGQDQELGVYVYYLTYAFDGANEDMIRGNITLIR